MDLLTVMAELSAIQPHQGVRLLIRRRQPLTREEAETAPVVSQHAKRFYYDKSRTVVDTTLHIGDCCKDLARSITLLAIFKALEDPVDPIIEVGIERVEYDKWSWHTDSCSTCGNYHFLAYPRET